MLTTALILFLAGLLTILLPCILPLIPVVVGVSIAGRSKWRPLLVTLGMVVSFVGFTFLLQVVLARFETAADVIRLATFDALLLFGVGFVTEKRWIRIPVAVLGGLFFWSYGWTGAVIGAVAGVIAMEIGGVVAARLQQLGADVQAQARGTFGAENPVTAFIIGLTLGLLWVPCAGPALSFVLTLIREQPGAEAFGLLTCYALGTAVPLLLVGYGGQAAAHSVRALTRYSGAIKKIAGVLLIVSALAFHFGWFVELQTWIAENTSYGRFADRLEQSFFQEEQAQDQRVSEGSALPVLGDAPEFAGLGPWINSEPLTLASLKGKVVLIDFWTYSCINCIRTLPYIQGYWEKYKDAPFVLIGVHSPEFQFERVLRNVQGAVTQRGLTYPVALDNDFGTWNAFHNRYWPAKYLIDAQGRIRYTHFGEGAYVETDEAIASLLQEIGVTVGSGSTMSEPSDTRRSQSPETYLGARSWDALENAQGAPGEDVIAYDAPASLPLHRYALDGRWRLMGRERQVLEGDAGEIRMRFLGAEVNLVMGLADGAAPGKVEVFIDGKSMPNFTVDRDDLYPLFTGEYGEHELRLQISGKGTEAYAFTFGS